MQALVEINFNSNTKRILATIVEGIEFSEANFKKPNASNAKWVLKTRLNVSQDGVLDIACIAVGRSLHAADAKVTIKYRKNNTNFVKTENIDDDQFSRRLGILIFKKEISL